jgi:anti-sigma B factor antagonist
MPFHDEPLLREELIVKYLQKRLDAPTTEAFESHYLICDECFEELRVSQLLAEGLSQSRIGRRYSGEIAILRFTSPVQLTRRSAELTALSQSVLEHKDTNVLIDLSRVSRIDSAGLGLLMSCYSHVIRNRRALKLLNPSRDVRELLRVTKIDAVLETYDDEQKALRSFEHS